MKLPKYIKIGGHKFNVVLFDRIASNNRGCIDYCSEEIRLSTAHGYEEGRTLTDGAIVCTLLHEIIHGIAVTWNVEDKTLKEDTAVDTVSEGLYQSLMDTPGLLELLIEHRKNI